MNHQQQYNEEIFEYMKNVSDFKNELEDISKTWEQLILLSQLGATGLDLSHTKENFTQLTSELITQLAHETLNKVINEMYSKASVSVDIVIRNLFERTADIGFLATDDDIRNFLLTQVSINNKQKQCNEALKSLQLRFKEYVAKYSVYYDIVLFDKLGNIVAKLDETNTITQTHDEIIDLIKSTSQDYVETYRYHDFLPQYEKSLVYSYKVTKTNDSDEIIGFLSLCFKFEDEMNGIFSKLVCKQNKETILLLDQQHQVIASSDPYHIPLYAKLETSLDEPYKITQFAGRDYIIKSCKTNGYEGFYGLGWIGHIMIPLDSAFKVHTQDIQIQEQILQSIMRNEELFKKELLQIPSKAQCIQDELDRAVWNGNVMQMQNDSNSADFARSILREVRTTGEKTKKAFKTSIEKLNQTIITSLLNNATFLATLSIDIMDRNLYERANDCRWWALTSTFRTILNKTIITSEDQLQLQNILKYINNLYTVYSNLILYDKQGNILAVSNENEQKLVNTKLTSNWLKHSLSLKDASKYCVSEFEETSLYGNENTYIYASSIFSLQSNDIVGGIAIVFDSSSQFKGMLKDALPKENQVVKKGLFSLFVEKQSRKIVSCSDDSHAVGEVLHIDNDFFKLNCEESLSKIMEYKNKYYIVGAKCSFGYREYKSHSDEYINDVLAFVFFEAGEIEPLKSSKEEFYNNFFDYQIKKDEEVEEIASFYIGHKWLGVPTSQIVEAISINHLETPVSMDFNHHFKGTVVHKNYPISVLDISSFIKNSHREQKHDIVIVNYDGALEKHTIGIVVDRLGEILKVPKQYIKPFDEHLISGGMLAQSIVQPPHDKKCKNLLTILNISKIGNLEH
jgi:chemotaxis signal transduction protein/predicted nucleic-acid-binding Zn-ribbon protein